VIFFSSIFKFLGVDGPSSYQAVVGYFDQIGCYLRCPYACVGIHSLDRQAVDGGWVLPHVPGIVPVDVCYLHMLFVCQVPFSLSGVGGDQPPHYLALAVSYLLSTDMETVCLVFIFYVMM
jgi:hypothetical protein